MVNVGTREGGPRERGEERSEERERRYLTGGDGTAQAAAGPEGADGGTDRKRTSGARANANGAQSQSGARGSAGGRMNGRQRDGAGNGGAQRRGRRGDRKRTSGAQADANGANGQDKEWSTARGRQRAAASRPTRGAAPQEGFTSPNEIEDNKTHWLRVDPTAPWATPRPQLGADRSYLKGQTTTDEDDDDATRRN